MTEEEMKSLRAGDKIKIISKIPEGINTCKDWDMTSDMLGMLGKTVTVYNVEPHIRFGTCVHVEEDSCCWHWYPHCVESLAESTASPDTVATDADVESLFS